MNEKSVKVTNRPLVLVSVMLAMFVGAVEATIVTTAMPAIASELGGFSRYSWVFSAYLLTSTVTVLVYGKLADLYGRKRILFIGLTIFIIGSILCGFAGSMTQLITFRLIQGLGAGAVMPIATTIIGDIYSTTERAKVQGYLASIWGVSAVLGPLIGGSIVQYFSWQLIFWINVPLGLLSMIGIGFYLHEPCRSGHAKINYKGAVLLTLSLSAIIFWLVEGGQSFGRLSIVGALLIFSGLFMFGIFVYFERTAKDPIMPFAIWKNRVILYANLVSFTTGFILIGVTIYIPTYVTGVMEQPAIIAGFTLTAMSIGWPIASSVAGHLLIRFGTFTVSFFGGIAFIIGAALVVFMQAIYGPWYVAMASFFIGIGMGLTTTSFIVTIQGAVPHEIRGSATAANTFMRNFGNTIGAALFGAVLNGALITKFKESESSFEMDAVNLLLTEEQRQSVSFENKQLLQHALADSLQWVYIGVAFFAVLSFVLILRIPRGKGLGSEYD